MYWEIRKTDPIMLNWRAPRSRPPLRPRFSSLPPPGPPFRPGPARPGPAQPGPAQPLLAQPGPWCSGPLMACPNYDCKHIELDFLVFLATTIP